MVFQGSDWFLSNHSVPTQVSTVVTQCQAERFRGNVRSLAPPRLRNVSSITKLNSIFEKSMPPHLTSNPLGTEYIRSCLKSLSQPLVEQNSHFFHKQQLKRTNPSCKKEQPVPSRVRALKNSLRPVKQTDRVWSGWGQGGVCCHRTQKNEPVIRYQESMSCKYYANIINSGMLLGKREDSLTENFII